MIKVGQTTTNETITLPYELTNDGDTSISLQELKGNTTQNGTPTPSAPKPVNVVRGKNLLNIVSSNTAKGIDYNFNKSELTLNGTTTEAGNIYNITTNVFTLESGTYTFSTTTSGTFTANSNDVAIYLKNKTNNNTISTLSKSNSYRLTSTFTISTSGELYIQIYTNGSGFSFNNFKINLQIEQGSIATSYLPYNTIQAKVVGKNLADISQIQIGKAWNSDSYTTRASILYIPVPKGKSYYLSSTYTSSAITNVRVVFNHGINDKANCFVVTSLPYTNNTWEYASIEVLANTTITSEMLNGLTIQFEQSNSPTTYEAYKSKDYPITLGDIELCKIGTYQDRIYKNNGKWYLEKQIGKYIFAGNESFTLSQSAYVFYLNNAYTSVLTDNVNVPYCNIFTGVTPRGAAADMNSANNNTMAVDTGTNKRFYFKTNAYSTTTDLANGLKNKSVYWILGTPTTTEITDETLLEQLDAIGELYRGTNNIMITDTIAPVENIIIEKSNAEFDLVPYIKREPKLDYIDRKGDTGYTADGHYFENIIARKRGLEFELIPMSQENYLSVISHFIDKTQIPVYIDDLFTGETNLIQTYKKEKIPTKQITENGIVRGTTIKLEEI